MRDRFSLVQVRFFNIIAYTKKAQHSVGLSNIPYSISAFRTPFLRIHQVLQEGVALPRSFLNIPPD